jgi:hypothetical protein
VEIGVVAGHSINMSWPVISTVERLKDRTDSLQARVKELEATDAAYRCASELLAEAESRATRLQQERDEAYERLISIDRIVHVPTSGKEAALHHFQRDFDAIRAITQPYRRLAGPEKEKPAANDGEERR